MWSADPNTQNKLDEKKGGYKVQVQNHSLQLSVQDIINTIKDKGG